MQYFYVRVSTIDQNPDRQLLAAKAHGISKENIYLDKLSGKNTARPALQKLLKTVQRGDTIVVESVSRLARNTRDLLDLVEKLTAMGVEFVSQKEHIDTTTPTGKFMLTIFGAVATLEREKHFDSPSGRYCSSKAAGRSLRAARWQFSRELRRTGGPVATQGDIPYTGNCPEWHEQDILLP